MTKELTIGKPKNILVAPLNWGLGHATRSIPIIRELLHQKFNPIIASDGKALKLLQKEFPELKNIELPSYNIQYPKKGKHLKRKLLYNTPHILKAIKRERKIVEALVESENLCGIISDNRFGVRSDKVPSVVISHQLKVLSGVTTFFTSKIHQQLLNKFDECWIPDLKTNYLSGKLSNSKSIKNSKFIGVLSRFSKSEIPSKYDLLVLLSGIEPLRTQLENKLLSELENYSGKALFVQGLIENQQKIEQLGNIKIVNYLLTDELGRAINESKLVLARSGYSTIMDIAVLGKKAFFIPTPGQNEQEYLAKHLEEKRIVSYSCQENFKNKMLEQVKNYSGFDKVDFKLNPSLFHLFHSK